MRDIRFLLKPKYSNSRALVIGINDYKNTNPLSNAVNDAKAIGDLLIEKFDFPKEQVTYLINQEATKTRIIKSYLRFADEYSDSDERIIVFFAGHGHTKSGYRGETGYLVPYDAEMSDLSTLLRWDELTRNAELIRAKHMLFIMDACYSGLALTRNPGPGSCRYLKDMMTRYSRQVMTAGKADEVVFDSGGPLPEHSIFTGHLIEGLKGNAEDQHGVLTANGLMTYVYQKVANDENSRQTPHYGYFDGDGDFILSTPKKEENIEDDRINVDELIVVPWIEEKEACEDLPTKVSYVKTLLSDDTSSIQLHDFMVQAVKQFLSASSEDHFKVQGAGFSEDEFLDRLSRYESVALDLAVVTACVAYWALPNHKQILQKLIARSTDGLESQGGLVVWIYLRWYPSIIQLYCSGVAAASAQRYDSLTNIFYTPIRSSEYHNREECFIESIAKAISELDQTNIFKTIPGQEKNYVPLSEYLFKFLQPFLDDALFIGSSYESSFDDFEVLFALSVADLRKTKEQRLWGPIGRFGWKQHKSDNAPLRRIIANAESAKENWLPLKQGMFGGNYGRFIAVAEEYQKLILQVNWW
jgi:Caspase domain